MTELDKLKDELETEREKRQLAEWHYQEAVKGGDLLHEECRRLREENARLRILHGQRIEPTHLKSTT